MRQQIDEDVQRPFEDMGWAERIDFVQRLSFYPALTVMVFLRRGLGFRMVKPNTLLIVALMLFAVGKYIPSTEYPPATPSVIYNPTFNDVAMMVFAVAVLLFGLVHRRRRWEDFRAGLPWHSYNEGDSWLLPFFGSAWLGKLLVKVVMRVARRSAAKTPNGPGARLMAALGLEKAPASGAVVPASSAKAPASSAKTALWKARFQKEVGRFLTGLVMFPSLSSYHVRRYVDPLVCLIAGFIVMLFLSPKLGIWLLLSGASLVIYEQARYDKRLDREFDIQDAIWDSENQKDSHLHFSRKRTPGREPRRRTAIPTGRASDTEALTRERRAEKAAPPP